MRRTLIVMVALFTGQHALANDDFIWGSYGGGMGYFDAPYVGLGFMADTWGAEFGLVARSDQPNNFHHYEPPHSDMTPVSEDTLVGFPVYLSILKGYAPNNRIAFYTSLGMLISSRCDVVESNISGERYCDNGNANLDLIPGVGALFTMGELTVGMGYQHGIGPLISVGTDF